jgi:putative uncharacterized protein (fragment)
MVRSLVKGEKLKLEQLFSALSFQVELSLPSIDGCDLDIACFGLDQNGHLSDDRFFIFYNQTNSPEDAIVMDEDNCFAVDLTRLPSSISKLVFTVTIDGDASMKALANSSFIISSGDEGAVYPFSGTDFADEKAIIVAEVYIKDDIWRMSAVGSGFNGGLDALLTSFGGEISEENPSAEDFINDQLSETPKSSPKKRPSTKKSSKKVKDPIIYHF